MSSRHDTTINDYHIIALKVSRRARKKLSVIECASCDAAFLIQSARGIVPRWPEVTYVERLKSMLAHDHAGKRKHRDASDLGA